MTMVNGQGPGNAKVLSKERKLYDILHFTTCLQFQLDFMAAHNQCLGPFWEPQDALEIK